MSKFICQPTLSHPLLANIAITRFCLAIRLDLFLVILKMVLMDNPHHGSSLSSKSR